MDNSPKMTPLRRAVLEILKEAQQPLGAYQILKQLEKPWPGAKPMSVYRVLDFLVSEHFIHKIAGNTYTTCKLPHAVQHSMALLFICNKCKRIKEFRDTVIDAYLQKLAEELKIKVDKNVLEFTGICQACQ